METFLQIFGGLVAIGAAAILAFVVAHQLIKLRRSWHQTEAARLLDLEAVEREKAETRKVHAEADTMLIKAQTEARLLPVNAGGAFGFIDLPTGLHVPAVVNANVATTYSPRIEMHGFGANVAAPIVPELPTSTDDLPGVIDLATVLTDFTPAKDSILLALGPGYGHITAPSNRLFHIALAGATRNGKSNIMRMMLAQLLYLGARVYLADPHFAPFDAETGEDWRPIAARLAQPPAFSKEDIEALFKWIALEEMPRRLEQRRQGQKVGTPIFLAVDELPAIVARIPETSQYMGAILREGAKVGVMCIGASQDFLVKTIGGAGAIRDCYRTAFYVGGDPTTGRVLLDVKGTPDDGGLGKGVVMLRTHTTQAERVRVPLASNEALYALLGRPSEPPTHEAASEPQHGAQTTIPRNEPAYPPASPTMYPSLGAAPDGKGDRARACYRAGMSVRDLATAAGCSTFTASQIINEMKGVR